MPSLDIKFNINGEVVELKDIDKVVKALTKKQRDEIDKLKKDIVSIDKQKVTSKQFEVLGNDKLRQTLDSLISNSASDDSVFTKMLALPVGMQASEFITYLDVKIKPGMSDETPVISVQPTQVATAARWQSKSFSSRVSNVTEASTSGNSGVFKAGSVKLLIKNNAVSSVQGFNSAVSSVVNDTAGNFKAGRFFINNKPVDLTNGDNLSNICTKINAAGAGVKATVGENLTGQQFKLTLESEKIGAENSILIDDPNGVLSLLANSGGNTFISDPRYENLTLAVGDTLENIAYKINKFEKTTNLRADIFQLSRGQYTLILKSMATGIDNSFNIIDKDSSNNDLILNGNNSGKVFNDVFNDTVIPPTGTKSSVTLAQNAKLIVDGTAIQGLVNSFAVYNSMDVIIKATSPRLMGFEIKHDANAIFTQVSNLIDRYNLFRQVYLDSISTDTKAEESQLKANYIISNAIENMSFALQTLEFLEIGISKGTLEMEAIDNDKTIKKEYKDMIILDKAKFIDKLTDDPEKIRKAFDISFESSSSNFIPPIVNKKISVNNKPLSASKIELNCAIDTSKLQVKSRASVNFTNPSNIVDPTGVDQTKLKPGTFWINGSAVTITNTISISDLVLAINSVSNMSRISATSSGNYLSLTKYSGGFPASDDEFRFQRMNIYDPNRVLQNVFTSVMQTGVFDQATLPTSGTFSINGVSISAQSSVSDLVSEINNLSSQTGVTASAIPTGGNNYYLQFISSRLQDILIDNSGGGLGSMTLPTVAPQQSNNYFFDTTNAFTGSMAIEGKIYQNPLVLTVNGIDIKSGGTIFPLNINNAGIKVDNLEVLFIGDSNDDAKISISEGLAANLIAQLDEIFKLQNGYNGSTSGILQVNNSISRRKEEIEKIIRNKEEILKGKEKILFNRFAKAQAQVDQGDAYMTMIKEMMKKDD